VCLVVLFLVACAGLGCRRPEGRLAVAVTLFPVFDLTRRVAGPDADVALLVPPGSSSEGFVLGADGRATLGKSRLLVAIGGGFDAWADAAIREASPGSSKTRTLRVVDRVPTHAPSSADPAEAIDPNVWLDPQRAQLIVKVLGEELARLDASHAAGYRQRASAIEETLHRLDDALDSSARSLRGVPLVVVGTQKAAYGYLAERFGLASVVGVPATAATAENWPALRRAHPGAIFCVDARAPAATRSAVAELTRLPAVVLEPWGGTAPADTYEKLVRSDVDALLEAQALQLSGLRYAGPVALRRAGEMKGKFRLSANPTSPRDAHPRDRWGHPNPTLSRKGCGLLRRRSSVALPLRWVLPSRRERSEFLPAFC
jgi:zinc transport system substrate-binding protein